MFSMELTKTGRCKADNLVARLDAFSDLFGLWTCEWKTFRHRRCILKQALYFDNEFRAMTWIEETRTRLRDAGWIHRDMSIGDFDAIDGEATRGDHLSHAQACIEELEYSNRCARLPMRSDVRAMTELLGLAFRHKAEGAAPSDDKQLILDLGSGTSVDEYIRQRSVDLFAGLMSYSLDGEAAALEVARRAQRSHGDERAFVRLIPKSRHNFLHSKIDDFVHPDRRLVRAALKIMTKGVWTVGDLVQLSEASVLRLLGGNGDDLNRLKRCLAEQNLVLNAAIPGWRSDGPGRRARSGR